MSTLEVYVTMKRKRKGARERKRKWKRKGDCCRTEHVN